MVMIRKYLIAACLIAPLAIGTWANDGNANGAQVLHTPLVSSEAGYSIRLRAQVTGDWRAESLILRVRNIEQETWTELEFVRTEGDAIFQVIIPGVAVRAPGFAYAILSVDHQGERRYHFASSEAPQHVNVYGYSTEMLMEDRLRAWDDNRQTFALYGQWIRFGSSLEERSGDLAPAASDHLSDAFWFGEAEYRYRPLRTIYDFGFGFGIMRGEMPTIAGTPVQRPGAPSQRPGLNYGFSDVRFSFHPTVTLGPRLILGANQEGFVAGAGANLSVGYLSGTHLAMTYDATKDVGYRADIRFHWATLPHVPMALGLDMTNWPYVGRPGSVNLSYDVGLRLQNTELKARIGRANRDGSLRPGIIFGLGIGQNF